MNSKSKRRKISDSFQEDSQAENLPPSQPILKVSRPRSASLSSHENKKQSIDTCSESSSESNSSSDAESDSGLQEMSPVNGDENDILDPICGEKAVASHGILTRLFLQNFMCHTQLEVKFGPVVNFVIGRNGSGKSAILTAITIGLGGKASVTNRGGSVKDLIQKGCSSAFISISIKNEGPEGYLTEIYGKCITVERKISKDASTYRLKSEDGRVISTQKHDLMEIVDFFEIQVDNPIQMLNQDTSRQFLNASSPEDKFKFFLKATQLDRLIAEYSNISREENHLGSILAVKKETFHRMKEELIASEKRLKSLESISQKKRELETLKTCALWRRVEEAENEFRDVKTRREAYQKTEVEFQEVSVQLSSTKTLQEAEIQEIQEKMKEKTERVKEIGNERNQIKQKIRTIEQQIQSFEHQKRHALNCLENDQKRCGNLEKQIDEIRREAEKNVEERNQERYEKLKEEQNQKELLEGRISQLNSLLACEDSNIETVHQEKEKIKKEKFQLEETLRKLQRKLSQLESSRDTCGGTLFGRYAPIIAKKIADMSREFEAPPVGPIGNYVKLTDEKWGIAVEASLGNILNAYVACCSKDASKLKKIIHQTILDGPKPDIIIQNFRQPPYRIPAFSELTPLKWPRIYDRIECDARIHNALINHRSIEKTLLFESVKEAFCVIVSKTNGEIGFQHGFVLDGQKVTGGKFQSITSDFHHHLGGSSSHESIYGNQRLGVNVDAQIQLLKEEIGRISGQISSFRSDLREKDEKLAQLISCQKDRKNQVKSLESSLFYTKQKISDLEFDQVETAVQVDTLLEEVENLKEAMQKSTATENLMNNQISQHETEFLLPLKAKFSLFENQIQTLENEYNCLVQQFDAKSLQFQELEREISKNLIKLSKISATLQTLSATLSTIEKKVQEFTDAATCQTCERISSQTLFVDLCKEISLLENRIQVEEADKGNPDEISKEYHEKKKIYTEAKSSFLSLQEFQHKLKQCVVSRFKTLDIYKKAIGSRARNYFQMLLSQKGYSGNLIFDWENQRLFLQVNVEDENLSTSTSSQQQKISFPLAKKSKTVHNSSSSSDKNNVKVLSGGERSFSTISFIMSLWESMECSLRVLDEFDVFMDAVNRRISMALLIQMAKTQRSRQYIFITPQDMSGVAQTDVRILKLRDPERNQRTLNFSSQNQNLAIQS